MENLVEEMIKYRAKNRLSQSAFAKKCGLSTQTVNNIENGIASPSKVTLAKIKVVLDEN